VVPCDIGLDFDSISGLIDGCDSSVELPLLGSWGSSCLSYFIAVVAQLVRASACHAEGRGFKSHSLRHAKQQNDANSVVLLYLHAVNGT
jgi:hypothetical protein